MDEGPNALWNWLDRHRNEVAHENPYRRLKDAIDEGVEVGAKEASWYLQRARAVERACPPSISDFIVAYLSDAPCLSVLDSWAGIGEVIVPIVDTYEPDIAIALERTLEQVEISKRLFEGRNIHWAGASPEQFLEDLDRTFDIAICSPPWGTSKANKVIPTDDGNIDIYDEAGYLLLLQTMRLLSTEGVGFALVTPHFMWNKNKKCVRQNLERFELFIEAALSLPSGSFAPLTQMGGLLLVINRKTHESLFVGELREEKVSNDVLLQNLKLNQEGKAVELGAIIEHDRFSSFAALLVEREIDNIARQLNLPKCFLSEISTEINGYKKSLVEGFEESPNVVYLPIIGNSSAATSLDELTIKPQNAVQIVLNPDVALAPYVANFFNTNLGQKIRESLTTGFIPKISMSSVKIASIFLPDISTQSELLSLNTRIRDLIAQLDLLHRQLWNHPRNTKKIGKALAAINRDDGFKTWIESLPFPLASILWIYHAEDNYEHKANHLIHFFEGLSEFSAAVMLSALSTDRQFFIEECQNCLEEGTQSLEKYTKASFGTWVILGKQLANATRRLISNEETKGRCIELYARPETSFIEMISSKEAYSILQKVSEYRNKWIGHGGVCSEREMRERVLLLEDMLSSVRRIIAEKYETTMLLAPGESEYSEGIHYYKASLLKGYATFFKRTSVQTRVPMDKKKLYMLHEGQIQPLELLPFLRLRASPRTEQNAVYFYNRLERGEARFVSYHFEGEPEILEPDEEMENVLSLLVKPKGTAW